MGRKPSTDTLDFSKNSGLLDLYMPFLDCLIFFSKDGRHFMDHVYHIFWFPVYDQRERERKKKKNSYLKRERPNSFQINLKDCETQVQFWLS